jgi:DNA helicase HerA-like ATPase
LLALVDGDQLREAPTRISRFTWEVTPAPENLARLYFEEFPAERDPATKALVVPSPLRVGTLLSNSAVGVCFNAAGFNRHTAVLAQSGSGKSYAVGILIEEILAKTSARIIIVDPNGDFGDMLLSLGAVHATNRTVRVRREAVYVAASRDPEVYERAIGLAMRGARGCLLDLNRLDAILWPSIVRQLLDGLWDERHTRTPTCVFVDEAHNFAPEAEEVAAGGVLEQILRIAAEGRKYGLWLTVASQRPQKVHSNLISQCDNLVLMKLTSQYDLRHVAESFSSASAEMIDLARGFKKGWSLAVGKIVKSPTLMRFRERETPEGGGDLGLGWAAKK